MIICAIIAEYNPFHNGHLYQIQQIKKELNASHIVVIMSGSFVQRGQSAIINKYDRAKLAIDNNVNLVIELPTYYTLQSAKYFAQGGVNILSSSNVIDYLVFGSESDNKNIKTASETIFSHEDIYNERIKNYMNLGHSYVKSTRFALESLGIDCKLGSNDILALEYTNALKDKNIKGYSIIRKGQNYLSTEKSNSFPSASYIREELKNNNIESLVYEVPENVFNYLNKDKLNINKNNKYLDILKYKAFVEKKSFDKIISYENGMGNLIKNNLLKSNNIDELIDKCTSSRYTKARISRLILSYLLDMKRIENVENYNYIRPIAFDDKGIEVLNLMKNNSEIPIVSKFSSYYKNNKNPLLDLELKASNLYNLHKSLVNEDFYISPFYKK